MKILLFGSNALASALTDASLSVQIIHIQPKSRLFQETPGEITDDERANVQKKISQQQPDIMILDYELDKSTTFDPVALCQRLDFTNNPPRVVLYGQQTPKQIQDMNMPNGIRWIYVFTNGNLQEEAQLIVAPSSWRTDHLL
ncbi:MAG: hypothetical protein NTU97_01880 [Candidatus Magasanikbacteria bacterium]|nr:hypothetical protein [Candidatus Magasanikbacteria bacterium]